MITILTITLRCNSKQNTWHKWSEICKFALIFNYLGIVDGSDVFNSCIILEKQCASWFTGPRPMGYPLKYKFGGRCLDVGETEFFLIFRSYGSIYNKQETVFFNQNFSKQNSELFCKFQCNLAAHWLLYNVNRSQ